MKNSLLLLLLGLFLTGNIVAQDAKGDFKDAKKSLSSYLFNNDVAELKNAGDKIESAMTSTEFSNDPKALVMQGDIYSEMVAADNIGLQMGSIQEPQFPDASFKAIDAYQKAHGLAEKSFRKTEALDGIRKNAPFLNQAAFGYYEAGDFANALSLFEKGLNLNDMLVKESGTGLFPNDSAYSNQVFLSSVMASEAGETEKAEMYLNKLVDMNYQDPLVYSNLFELHSATDEAKAMSYLEKGRALFPGNVTLLFAEINHYLQKGELNVLIDKLQAAIEAEPENPSVRMTLGSVYEQLHNRELEAGNADKAEEYFASAKKSYQEALDLDPQNDQALYSIGALYFNKAANMVPELNALSDDYSNEGTKKYNAVKAKMDNLFDQALPFFEKAYAVNAKDKNTLIALKEMYVRKGELEKSEKIKKELENIRE